MSELPMRKHPRLKGYDYNQNGAYFITFCTKEKLKTLGRVVGCDAPGASDEDNESDGCSGTSGESGGNSDRVGHDAPGAPYVKLTGLGEAVRKEIEETHAHYDSVVVDKFVVMPNHVHLIALINSDRGTPGASRPTNALIPRIVTMIKKKTNRAFGSDTWQHSFHDHIIRDEAEYLRIWQYIDDNPALWIEDGYFVAD